MREECGADAGDGWDHAEHEERVVELRYGGTEEGSGGGGVAETATDEDARDGRGKRES